MYRVPRRVTGRCRADAWERHACSARGWGLWGHAQGPGEMVGDGPDGGNPSCTEAPDQAKSGKVGHAQAHRPTTTVSALPAIQLRSVGEQAKDAVYRPPGRDVPGRLAATGTHHEDAAVSALVGDDDGDAFDFLVVIEREGVLLEGETHIGELLSAYMAGGSVTQPRNERPRSWCPQPPRAAPAPMLLRSAWGRSGAEDRSANVGDPSDAARCVHACGFVDSGRRAVPQRGASQGAVAVDPATGRKVWPPRASGAFDGG